MQESWGASASPVCGLGWGQTGQGQSMQEASEGASSNHHHASQPKAPPLVLTPHSHRSINESIQTHHKRRAWVGGCWMEGRWLLLGCVYYCKSRSMIREPRRLPHSLCVPSNRQPLGHLSNLSHTHITSYTQPYTGVRGNRSIGRSTRRLPPPIACLGRLLLPSSLRRCPRPACLRAQQWH